MDIQSFAAIRRYLAPALLAGLAALATMGVSTSASASPTSADAQSAGEPMRNAMASQHHSVMEAPRVGAGASRAAMAPRAGHATMYAGAGSHAGPRTAPPRTSLGGGSSRSMRIR